MKYEEIYQLLQYNDYKGYESNIFMPNEIFEDLKANIKNTPHIAFAYSYMYLVTWLYRYTKHISRDCLIDNNVIKQILGYSAGTRSIDFLIKKNGLLDKMEYTITTRNFPVLWNQSNLEDEPLDFELYNEAKEIVMIEIPNRFTVKYPVKAFERIIKTKDGELETYGTFYDVDNTHNIPFEVFMYCMGNEDIGCTGFYLYSYLKHKNDIYEGGYDVSLQDLSSETGIAERTLDKYLNALKGYRMIDFKHNQEFFAIGLKEEDRKANTYITKGYDQFSDDLIPFHKITIMRKKDYFKMLEEEETAEFERLFGNTVDIPLEELPY